MSTGGSDFVTCIVSKGRADSVRNHTLLLFPDAVLIVPPDEVGLYKSRVDVEVIAQTGPGVSGARNTALDAFVGQTNVLMLDDDIKEIGEFGDSGKVAFGTVAERIGKVQGLFRLAKYYGAYAFSCAPTDNQFYYSADKRISTNLFLIGTFSGYLQGCPIRYDEALSLKEDYDFTIQIWRACGVALRFNYIYCSAIHYTNSGGAVDTRNNETERAAISILLQRWPQYVRLNPRRRNEVLLKLPKKHPFYIGKKT